MNNDCQGRHIFLAHFSLERAKLMKDWIHTRAGKFLLAHPIHDDNHLPVRIKTSGLQNLQVVNEFRSKLRMAEEMMAKFSYSLREIQGMPKRGTSRKTGSKINRRPDLQIARRVEW
jgi:hypothetical protein